MPFVSAYSITKYGVEAFSDALRREMYPWGVKVSILEPGAFQTNMSQPSHVEKSYKASWEILDDQLKKEYGEKFLNEGIYIVILKIVLYSLERNAEMPMNIIYLPTTFSSGNINSGKLLY